MKNLKKRDRIKILSFQNFILEKYIKNESIFNSQDSINVEEIKDVILRILQDMGIQVDVVQFAVFDEKLKN